jgi:DNA-binding GntR family transcriptional regulator
VVGVVTRNEDIALTPRTRSAREIAYAVIRDGILTGEFRAGSFIEETEISSRSGLSRTPVREALNRLAAEGYVELLPRRGAMVRHVTAQELNQLYEVRRLIEGHAARILCENHLPVPEAMRLQHAAMQAMSSDDIASHVERNRWFHHALVESTGNAVLTRIFAEMHTSVTRVSLSALSLDVARHAVILAEHQALIDALADHDAAAALAVLDRHLHPVPQLLAQMPR